MRVKLVKAHEGQMKIPGVKEELTEVQRYVDGNRFELPMGSMGMLFIYGSYDDFTKKMSSVIVFANNTGKAIDEIYGTMRFELPEGGVEFAKTTVGFDREFLGRVEQGEAVLVHLSIPVKGLDGDREFKAPELKKEFGDVRVAVAAEPTGGEKSEG